MLFILFGCGGCVVVVIMWEKFGIFVIMWLYNVDFFEFVGFVIMSKMGVDKMGWDMDEDGDDIEKCRGD